jgi:hypothetical protein
MLGPWQDAARTATIEGLAGSLEATARTGTWWTGVERVQIAETARAARMRRSVPANDLPGAAREAATFLAATPAHTTERLVGSWIERLGEFPYIELFGVVARTVAFDTFVRALGLPEPAFREPDSTPPTGTVPDSRRGRAWISTVGYPSPPNTVSAVPTEREAYGNVERGLYMPEPDMEEPDNRVGGLHRTQVELVAATVSHANECFF